MERVEENWNILAGGSFCSENFRGSHAQPAMVVYRRCLMKGKVESFQFHLDIPQEGAPPSYKVVITPSNPI